MKNMKAGDQNAEVDCGVDTVFSDSWGLMDLVESETVSKGLRV